MYKFSELSKIINRKVLYNKSFYNTKVCNLHESIFEDVEMIGLKISKFNLNYNNEITGNFLYTASSTIERILVLYEKNSPIYLIADNYKKIFNNIEMFYLELSNNFLRDLLNEYFKILIIQYGYFISVN